MESIRDIEASLSVEGVLLQDVEPDLEAEFDALVEGWIADQDRFEGPYSEAQDCLDALLEARAVMASMQAQEQRCLARLEAIALESAGEGATGTAKELAWRSMVAEVAVATRQADRTVQTAMGRASALVSSLPATLAALETGQISLSHARVILEHADGIEADALREYEHITVVRAEATTPGKLASTAKVAAARLRAGSLEERHARAREGRSVSIRDLAEGMSELVQLLPTVYAAAVFDRLTRQAKAIAATGDSRTRDQLRADLMTDLLLTGEPARGEGAPHTAAEGIRAEVAIVIPALTLLGHGDEPATLLGRGPIDLDTACRLASLVPELVRVLTHPVTGMAITADTYRPTAGLRRYLEHRDRHCQFPVCNRDARYGDLDHTVPWEQGGRTVPENLAVMCRGHHTLKHNSAWKVKQVSPGILEWTSPLGHVIRSDGTRDAGPPGPRFVEAPNDPDEGEPPPF